MDTSTRTVSSINGVSVYNKAGNLKSNYTNDQRLQILGATAEELQTLIDLFCPDRPRYAITRAKSTDPRDWTTPKGRVSETEILNHLQGNLVPGKNPRWVAPRSWEVTQWVGVDVDLRNEDDTDFNHRCKRVRRGLKRLGVCSDHLLVSNTPSGGKHYRFFLTHKIRVCEIENIFRRVGIEECSGKFELFPRMNKGMRLPFGYLPGKPFRPEAWLKFIRDFQKGEFPLVNWRNCVANSRRFLDSHGLPLNPDPQPKTPADVQPLKHESKSRGIPVSHGFGVPKRMRLQKSSFTTSNQDEYLRLLGKSPTEFTAADARRIWELGIRAPGTRVAATKKMAWHLCHRNGLAPTEVVRSLVDWAYRSGAEHSQSVQQDLADKTRKVEKHTREIVGWFAAHPPTRHAKTVNHSLFSKAEVDELILKLRHTDVESREELLEFALNFLRYAKLHGEATLDGWEASVTAARVMRKWPRSSGSKYKQKRDLLEALGLVAVTRKEWKSRCGKGRARTYLFKVAPSLSGGASLTTEEALRYANQAKEEATHEQVPSTEASCNCVQVDSYKRVEETTQRIGLLEVETQRDLTDSDHKGLKHDSTETPQQGENAAAQCTAQSNVFDELRQEHLSAARKQLRLPYLNKSPRETFQPTDLDTMCPQSLLPLDLASLVELGLSPKALDYLTNRPPQLGIPKAIRLELELLASKTHREQLSQIDILREPPPLVGRSLPNPLQPERGTTYAYSQPNAQRGYT